MLALFDDAATIAHALAFEAVLARAQSREGLISDDVAETIAAACETLSIDPGELADEAALAGTLAIPLVRRLRAALPTNIADKAHLGATSQDVADTALMLQVKHATILVLADSDRITRALALLATAHVTTPAIGRTLLQDALPVSFGLRIAQWTAGIDDAATRLASEVSANARIQFGGAAGTRAGLNGKGSLVAAHMADSLDLA
jgi:3-carboxy-cis,cis-muconate cycloisomerase